MHKIGHKQETMCGSQIQTIASKADNSAESDNGWNARFVNGFTANTSGRDLGSRNAT